MRVHLDPDFQENLVPDEDDELPDLKPAADMQEVAQNLLALREEVRDLRRAVKDIKTTMGLLAFVTAGAMLALYIHIP